MSSTMRQVIGYIRVSTDEQTVGGISLEAQEERIKAWCVAKGLDLVAIYRDVASGKKTENRPGFNQAVEHVLKIRASLLAYKLDRLNRNAEDALKLLRRLTKKGCGLQCIDETFDTDTAWGRAMFQFRAVIAELERALVSERTTTALRHKRSNGLRTGGIPYGYDLGPDGKSLVPNLEEQAVLKQIISARNDYHWGYQEIADWLNKQGIPSKKGKKWRLTSVKAVIFTHSRNQNLPAASTIP